MAEQVVFWFSVIALVVVSGLVYFEKKKVINFFDHDKNGKQH